jgi:hypothetical protein
VVRRACPLGLGWAHPAPLLAAAQITQAVASLVTKRRLLISGTPIQNDLTEFFAVFDTALPGASAAEDCLLPSAACG